jgi:putative SOS response-associated peptidase YedK
MCGRATLVTPPEVIAALFGLDEVPDLEPRFNIAPSQAIAIVRRDPARPGRRLELAEWGFSGAGAANRANASARAPSRIVNVRVESMFTRVAFREAAAARRCLVVVDGFYEWRGTGRTKQAFHVRRRDARPFALGGLWDGHVLAEGGSPGPVVTCAILTTTPAPPVDALHDRMPLMIAAESYDDWLDPSRCSPEEIMKLARAPAHPTPAGELVAVAVSAFVNDPAREGARCLEPEAQTELL